MSTYVYGFVRAGRRAVPGDVTGVGDPPAAVRAITAGRLAALACDAPEDLRPTRRDLLAHQRVLAAAEAAGAVLPLRFGTLFPDDESVRRVLTERAGHYDERLDSLRGRAEFDVRAAHREEDVLFKVAEEEPEIRALGDAQRAEGGRSAERDRRLGEMVANAVREREIRDARRVREALAPYADAVGPGAGDEELPASMAFLVPRDGAEEFVGAVEELGAECAHLELRAYGPLPPYSFVEPGAAGPAPASTMCDRRTGELRRGPR